MKMRVGHCCRETKLLDRINKELFDKLGVMGVKPVFRGDRYMEYRVDDIVSKLADIDSYDDLPP